MLVAVALPVVAACAQVLGLDTQETLKQECETKADCNHPCRLTDCVENKCLESPISGPPLFGEENDCATATCDSGELVTTNKDEGTPCGNGLACDGDGTCVGCRSDDECVGGGPVLIIDDKPAECGVPACIDQVCGLKPAPEGRAPNDLPGDCARANCDGMSVYASSTEIDPGDAPPTPVDEADMYCVGTCVDQVGLVYPPDNTPCFNSTDMTMGLCCGGKCDFMNNCLGGSSSQSGGNPE